jgi:hypothetical protein
MKEEKKYAMLQISTDVHQLLKNYCDEKGLKMGALVSILIKKHINK